MTPTPNQSDCLTRQRPTHGADAAGVLAIAILALCFLAAMSGCEASGTKAPTSSEVGSASKSIPQPVIETTPAGGRQARLDIDALEAWCRDQGLPPPPNVQRCEPGIAEALTTWLAAAAADRTDKSFGAVGQICYVIQDYDAAIAYLEKAADIDPTDSRWPYFVGVIQQERAVDASAIKSFYRAIELNPDLAIASARVSQIHVDRGELALARQYATNYARRVPRDSLGQVLLGRVLIEEGTPDAAIPVLEAAIEKMPNDFQAHYYLGRALAQLGRTEEARIRLDDAASMPRGNWFNMRDPLRAAAIDVSGSSMGLVRELEALIATDQWDRMATLMEQIIALRAGDFKMMSNLADVYRKLGRFDDAHAMIDRALVVAPEMAELYSKRAALFLAQGRNEDAVVAADRAIEGSRADYQAYSVKGRAFFLLKRFEDAAPALRRAVEIKPEDAQGWQLLGVALHHEDRLNDAAVCYRRVQSLIDDPEHALYKEAVSNLKVIERATNNASTQTSENPGG